MVLTSTKKDRRRPPRPPVPDPASPDANLAPSRFAAAPGDSQRAAQRTRPATTPAYYLGRPASYWLALNRRRDPSRSNPSRSDLSRRAA
jgi:hypothetical protein